MARRNCPEPLRFFSVQLFLFFFFVAWIVLARVAYSHLDGQCLSDPEYWGAKRREAEQHPECECVGWI